MQIGKVAILVTFGAVLALPTTSAAQEYIWGTCTAELATDPAYCGYWWYCIEIEWDVTGPDGYGLSTWDVFLGLEECLCVCSEGYFAFEDTVGSGPGTTREGPGTVYWHGYFSCDGDGTFRGGSPLVKFEYFEDTCEPDKAGSASVCFYSVAEPASPTTYVDALGIKFGTRLEKGDLVGVLPTCAEAYSSVESSTWSRVKVLYR
jgi:hypothetical protein